MISQKTGLLYDARMLEHKARRKHPQTPQRIITIFNLLSQYNILSHPRVDFISTIPRLASQEELKFAHSDKYISFCQNLWPKTGHRTDITVLDTYFNEQSEKIAKIASGGLLVGVDKLMKNQWQNAFAIVRPPGHHSGAKNTINGFCIYNNVAIAANYLLKQWKKKKVCILDWDVHHGDGTQHIMQKNQNVLFISLHRHDRGTYYPAGDDGSFQNNGQEQAKGTKVNIPFDFVDEKYQKYNFQAPGDNEYIYLYHRVVEPIIREFDPEVILVSSGFDAAVGDPLGGFTVTPNGYHYLTSRVLQLKKPTLIALEGGYNLTAIKKSAHAVILALLKEPAVEPLKDYRNDPIKQIHLKEILNIHPTMHQHFDKIIEFHSQYWKSLNSEELKKYTQRIKANESRIFSIIEDQEESDGQSSSQQPQFQFGVGEFDKETGQMVFENVKIQRSKSENLSVPTEKPPRKLSKREIRQREEEKLANAGKEEESESVTAQFYFAAGHMQRFKNFSLSNPKIHKWAYEPQIKFFESNFEEKKFAPHYYGKQDNYIILQNLLFEQKSPIIMDVKLSRQSKNPFISEEKKEKEKKKQLKSTADKLAFRISGYTTADYKEGGIITYSEEEVKKILKIIVDQSNKEKFCEFLERMANCMKEINRKYWGTSIMLVKGEKSSQIRWIDFHYYVEDSQEYDQDLVQGLENLRNCISSI